ncbi:MAG: alpha/beta hydrolase, partial [Eubacterium sp.]|nr:alpha/beta hydrolase [Eubacterium sp.]
INVNNININYEVFGEGMPIILLHGNSETHKVFDKLIERLQNDYKVYAIDSRCHGESEDTKEISYDLMAEDVIAFIKALGLEKPILYGFSDGGIVGLLIAIKEPDLLLKLIVSGANINPNGLQELNLLFYKIANLVSKNKLVKMMVTEPDIKPYRLNKIKIPVYVLAGEKDLIRRKHTQLIAESIPNSTLKIIKNETHGSYIVHSDKIYHIIKKFI